MSCSRSNSRSRARSLPRCGVLLVLAVALLVAVASAPGAAAAVGSADATPSPEIDQPFVPLQVEDPAIADEDEDEAEDEEGDDDAEAEEEDEEDDEPATVEDAVPPDEVGSDDDEEGEEGDAVGEAPEEDAGGPGAEPETGPDTGPGADAPDADGGEDGAGDVPIEGSEGEDGDDDAEVDEDADEEDADADDDAAGVDELDEGDGAVEEEEDDDGGVLQDPVGAAHDYASDTVDSATPDWTPEDWMEGIFGWTFEDIMDGIGTFIDLFSEFLVGVPAPGDPLDPMSWYFPEDDPVWETVLNMYWTLVALSLPLLTISVMRAMSLDDPIRRQQMLKENVLTVGMYFVGPLLIGLLTHTADVLATGLVPAGEEFLASPEEVAQLGVGTILGVAIALASPLILAAGIAIIVLVTVIILISAAAWPLAWTARSSGIASLRSMGNLVVTSFTLLLILRGIQSIGLRFLFEIPLEELSAGALAVFLVLNALGLYYLLYRLPRGVLEKTFAASAVTLGMSYMPRNFSAADAARSGRRGYRKTRSAASSARSALARRLPDNVAQKGSSSGSSGSSQPRPGASPATRTPVSSGGSSGTGGGSGPRPRRPSGSGSSSDAESESGPRRIGKIGRVSGRDRYRHMKRSPTAAGSKSD